MKQNSEVCVQESVHNFCFGWLFPVPLFKKKTFILVMR